MSVLYEVKPEDKRFAVPASVRRHVGDEPFECLVVSVLGQPNDRGMIEIVMNTQKTEVPFDDGYYVVFDQDQIYCLPSNMVKINHMYHTNRCVEPMNLDEIRKFKDEEKICQRKLSVDEIINWGYHYTIFKGLYPTYCARWLDSNETEEVYLVNCGNKCTFIVDDDGKVLTSGKHLAVCNFQKQVRFVDETLISENQMLESQYTPSFEWVKGEQAKLNQLPQAKLNLIQQYLEEKLAECVTDEQKLQMRNSFFHDLAYQDILGCRVTMPIITRYGNQIAAAKSVQSEGQTLP